MERSTYKNLEFVIVENNSTDPATFAYYEKMQRGASKLPGGGLEGGVQLLRHQ